VKATLAISAALLAGLGAGASIWHWGVPAPGVVLELDGYSYSLGAPDARDFDDKLQAAIAVRSRQLGDPEVVLRADELSFHVSGEKAGLSWDSEAALRQARSGIESALGRRSKVWLSGLQRDFLKEPVAVRVDIPRKLAPGSLAATLKQLAGGIDEEAVDAELLIAEHRILASREGRRLSPAATLLRMKSLKLRDAVVLDAVLDRTEPRVTEEQLTPVDITQVLASYVTSFRGKAGARATNIRTAGKYLDGAVLMPGEVLSFNERVGRRIHGRGFVDAPVIVNDELELDVGGGVCQVATTLHAAAVFGNVEVTRRRSHSRPSGYAPLGLDATVIDGKVDLRLRNPYEEPLLVHVSYPSRFEIKVELLGRSPEVSVDHGYTVTEREPFVRRIWEREEMPLGGIEKKQKGSQGMDVVSVLRIRHQDGTLSKRQYFSKYYPVPEVFWVGEGASGVELPEMPEGAKALVVNGEEVAGSSVVDELADPSAVPTLEAADGGAVVDPD